MKTKKVNCSVVKELREVTGEIKMAKSNFMRTVNATKKWPKDLIQTTNIIEIQKSICLAIGKTCKVC